jgi:hypothetical protein
MGTASEVRCGWVRGWVLGSGSGGGTSARSTMELGSVLSRIMEKKGLEEGSDKVGPGGHASHAACGGWEGSDPPGDTSFSK